MPYITGFGAAHIHPAHLVNPTGAFYTGDQGYYDPSVARIIIKSLDKSKTYYQFDPFTYGNNAGGVTYASLSLGTNQHGSFEVEFEDTDKTIDDTLVRSPARCYIYFGKTQSQLTLMLSGMIRQNGYTRGCENNLLYSISGFGTGVRLNERILDVNEAASKLLADGQTIDTSDINFQAHRLADDIIDDTGFYPENITSTTVDGTGGFGYLNSSGSSVDSDVHDFIPEYVVRFNEIADAANILEDFTGARYWVDTDDRVHLDPLMTPLTASSGFLITATPDLNNDLAANTMYIDAESGYTWTDSIQKDAGYSSGMYAILPSTPVPDVNSGSGSTYFENKTVEIAQRFRPVTNPNWRIYAAVEAVGIANTDAENTFRGRWRIANDNGDGTIKNVGGIVSNKYMYPNQFYNTGDGGLQYIQIMGIGNQDLDENQWYWLILSSTNATGTQYWRWYHDNGNNGIVATNSPGASDANNGGAGWTYRNGPLMQFTIGRFKAEPFGIIDEKAFNKRTLIESTAQSFPQQITSKVGANKYLVGLMQYAARPRRVFQFPSLTVPNRAIFPGDIAYIVDPRFNFSTAGNPVITGTITDLNYSFGVKGAGLSPNSRGMTSLALNVVSYNQFY